MADKVNDLTQQQPPVIEFPCHDYPVKIMGERSDTFIEFVLATTESFAPTFDRNKVTVKQSSKARFTSVTVFITATGAQQLEAYHQALKNNSAVKIVL
ncbi:MAG: putative lipoic acid-binding regulatory protein [Granulosicoccus sp.]|jgi:putative lipoic acid-binding regulatory protein